MFNPFKFNIMDYLKKNPLTEEQLLRVAVDTLSTNLESISLEDEKKVTEALANVEGYKEYLSALMNNDIKRHFKASTPVEQINARGAFGRALYLRSRLVKLERAENKEVKIPKLTERVGRSV